MAVKKELKVIIKKVPGGWMALEKHKDTGEWVEKPSKLYPKGVTQ